LLAYDWQAQPVKTGLANQIGTAWMAVRPHLSLLAPDSDLVASLLAALALFPIVYSLRDGLVRVRWLLAGAAATLAILAGIFLAGEREAWLSLGGAAAVWLWWLASGRFSKRLLQPRRKLFLAGLLSAAGLWLLAALTIPGVIWQLIAQLFGPDGASSRLATWQNTLQLILDFRFTGAGLEAFPGVYSQYILGIPYLFLDSSHNLYLEIAIEQGLFALCAFGGFLAVSFWRLGRRLSEQDGFHFLRIGLISALLAALLYGLVENAYYHPGGLWLLFLLPGFAAGLEAHQNAAHTKHAAHSDAPHLQKQEQASAVSAEAPGAQRRRPGLTTGVAALALVGLLGLASFYKPLLSGWFAGLGAVDMARVQLAGFPTGRWEESQDLQALAPAEKLFDRALQFDPQDRTAHYRLGLIAMLRYDFDEAAAHLELAHLASPSHRGIRKSLGYSYVWSGDYGRAEPLLSQLSEVHKELDVYTWWWQAHGQDELAALALQAHQHLKNSP
jgi:tetratricopeptide (TPR) repeat protein